ncbi:MAG: TetR/AcrR family transcriptional regulator [Anaerolineae bacterium]
MAAILQAAREVMRAQGVANMNLQDVARSVGMRAPSLYHYFPSRLAIYDALFVMGMQMYRSRAERIWAEEGATWAGIRRIMTDYLDFALEHPELYQLLFERPVPGFMPSPAGIEESLKVRALGERISAEAIANGTLPSGLPADAITNFMIAIMHGITAQHLANEPHLPADQGRFGSLIPVVLDMLKTAWRRE